MSQGQKNGFKFSRRELHNQEERIKHAFRDQIAEAAGLVEVFISILVLIGLVMAAIPLIQWMPGLLVDGNEVDVQAFLERALEIVIGVEFIKMLAKHSPGASLEVLLYAMARHMVVGHSDAVDTLFGILAIGVIFFIRKFLFVPSFGSTMPGPDRVPAPDMPQAAKVDDEPVEDDPHLTFV